MHTRARRPNPPSRRSGQSLVFTLVILLGILAVLALAIDLGMLFTARAEAQRAADAAALAGASAFQDYTPLEAVDTARGRAYALAERNHIRNELIKASEVTVDVKPDSDLVRVWVRRDSLRTWFARLIGFDFAPVGAKAAARAVPADAATCLKPWAVPDMWDDVDQDTNHNHLWDPGEDWVYTGDGTPHDNYGRFVDPAPADVEVTGYGSDFRDASSPQTPGDVGRQLAIKFTDPQSEFSLTPGIFLPWRLPTDTTQASCGMGGGGLDAGAAVYRQNICSCNHSPIDLFTPYELEPGNMVGPTAQGVKALIDEDQGAHWNTTTNTLESDYGLASPRVVKIALFAPGQVTKGGMQTIVFNNFARFFIEEQAGPQAPVVGRFMGFVDGTGRANGPTGSLVLVLRLVE